jgi:O-antigen/teichoic acid export membrane protein
MQQHTLQDNKRIAKNTVFLYIRMLFVMGVSLFTSRVVLDKLGVEDYGIYNAVGGVVAMLMFLNGTLSTSTSRFLTFELGRNDIARLTSTFSTAFYAHLILALLVVLFMETIGLWFVYNKLIIPLDRMYAALWAFHISVFTAFIAITQVPYTSVIIAHENMKVYAYMGIFEAVAKLVIVYLLVISSVDKLIFYACLVGIVQLLIAVFYRLYCVRNYVESHITRLFDKNILRRMLSFSGLSLLANVSHVLSVQGLVVLMNMFFQPVVVAAQAIGNQLTNAMMQFVGNLQTALNPQIIKLYATGAYTESRRLTLQSSVYVHELMLLLCLPAIVTMDSLLHLWLVEVPAYAVIFAQYIIIKQLFNVYNMTLYTPMIASGKLLSNSLAALFGGIGAFILLYVLLKLGFDVMWIQYISVFQAALFSYIVKPYILCKEIGYSWSEILWSFWGCIKVSIIPVLVSVLCYLYITIDNVIIMFGVITCICISVLFSAYIFLDEKTRNKLHVYFKQKLLDKIHFS